MDWRISKRTAVVSGVVVLLLLLGVALALWATGGFGGRTDTSSSPGQSPGPSVSPSPSPSPSPSGSASETKPGTHPTEPAVVSPTVAQLRRHLAGILRSTPFGSNEKRKGTLTCDGSGPVSEGTALRCEWRGVYTGSGGAPLLEPPRAVYVAVLDDSGRYTFQMFDADPNDYPKGTTDCSTLKSPPGAYPWASGMAYSTLLYYWMANGSPASMDDDGNGLPCETVYPAGEVARVAASPLVPGNTPGVDHTLADVRQHLEAVRNGVSYPPPLVFGELIFGEALTPDGSSADTGSPAVTGTTFTAYQENVQGGVQVTVLDDDARYAYSYPRCCGWGPNVTDYPDDATCKQLSELPVDSPSINPSWTGGLPYPFVVYYWMSHGSPDRLDKDGNGRPCEVQYPKAEVKSYFNSKLQP